MMLIAPFCTAVMPDAHWRITVWADARSLTPARRAATRAMLGSSELWRQCPMTTSSTSSGSMPERESVPSSTTRARSTAGTGRRVPPILPTAVRHGATITISFTKNPSEILE